MVSFEGEKQLERETEQGGRKKRGKFLYLLDMVSPDGKLLNLRKPHKTKFEKVTTILLEGEYPRFLWIILLMSRQRYLRQEPAFFSLFICVLLLLLLPPPP